MRESRKEHWQSFWIEAERLSLDDVYGNDGRILREIFATADPRGMRVLEVGAGTGRDSLALAGAGAELVTLDYVPESLRLIRNTAKATGAQVEVVGGDGLKMPFADESFDLVFHQGLLEHFRDPLPLLRENMRVLKPGGILLVDVPQRYHYYTLGKHLLMLFDKWFAGWETEFTIGELEELVREVGLDPERSYGDWMVPGLWYRALRKVLLKSTRMRLPMYPPGIWPFAPLAQAWRGWFLQQRASLYTTIVVGCVARKRVVTQRESSRSEVA
jgi:ubiquinone/menaquinone biosynthesis C-methylase UbiE